MIISAYSNRKRNFALPDTEECHECKDEGDTDPSLNLIFIPVVGVSSNHGANDKVRGGHTDGSEEERRLSSDLVKDQECRYDSDQLYQIHDTRHQELKLVVEAELLKQGRRVVDQL